MVGLSFDFLMYNIQGFLFYSIYSVTKYVAQREQSLTLTIEPNDIAFGVHAVLLTLVNIFQCTIYEVLCLHIFASFYVLTLLRCK